ncbi:hypothetical protein Fmac_008800 [Flemingia macrophylla]|uniref:Uncharacterized protein n=1 Tax=Flemingia macrophylla TaxID=520843 RepID=A0ABD1MYF0_9FABA
MTRTTLDFTSTFQRHLTTAIIMPSSFPLSLTLHHHHHHYPLNSPFIIKNTITIIHQPLIALADYRQRIHHHNQEPFSHTKQGHEQAQDEADKVKNQCLLMVTSKP